MNFIKHPQHNLYMGAPRDWNEERDGPCGSLSIHDMRNERLAKMESAWAPDGFEGSLLAMNLADIRLGIIGQVHPPVYMAVYPKSGIDRKARENGLRKVLQELADYAEQLGFVLQLGSETNSNRQVADVMDIQPSTGG